MGLETATLFYTIARAYNKRGLVTFIDGEILNVTKNKLTRAHVIVSTCAKHARDPRSRFSYPYPNRFCLYID